MFNFIKKSMIENREADALLYEYVFEEIENDIIIKSLWAQSIAMSKGNEDAIHSLYMQYRVQNIKDQFTKLNICYSELQKEVLFNKIKFIFNDAINKDINSRTSTAQEDTQETHHKGSWNELFIATSAITLIITIIIFVAPK